MRTNSHRRLHHGDVVQAQGKQVTVLEAWYYRNRTVVVGFLPDGSKCKLRVR